MQTLLFQSILFLLLSVDVEMQCASPSLQPARSARWDRYIQGMENQNAANRVKRMEENADDDICLWTQVDAVTCGASGSEEKFTRHDAIGRRRGVPMALGPPENQGMCGSCWAFATTGALFDQLKFSNVQIQKLSAAAQYLITCLKENVNNGDGCCGSKTLNAGIDFIREHGIPPDTCLPQSYTTTLFNYNKKRDNLPACPSQCMAQTNNYMVMRFEELNSESDIIRALDQGSFVIAGMKVTDEFKRVYKCGVYTESLSAYRKRRRQTPGHAVEIVDYGSCSGENFWVVKNSWGDQLHERGYFRIKRGGFFYRDLDIADKALKIVIDTATPGSPTQTPVKQPSMNFLSCSADQVSRPQSDEMTMSAAEFIVQNIMPQSIRCPDEESSPTGIVLGSVNSGRVQSVSGSVVDIGLTANLEGCTNPRAKLDITDASVVIYLDNTFSVVNCGNYRVSSGKGVSIMSFITLFLSASILFLIIV